MMKKAGLIYILFVAFSIKAQDIHFSQTAQTPLLINPAAAGVYDGWERVIVNHRNQWLGASTQFMTTSIAADVNFGKTRLNDQAHLGLGLMFFNDIGGDANFGTQTGALTLSGILPMGGSGHILSAGLQGGFGQRSADFDNLRFYNQWDGTSLNPDIASGEASNGTSFSYLDASAGVQYLYDGGKNTFARHQDFKLTIGLSGYHLNKPELKYSNGLHGEQLLQKFVAHVGIVAEVPSSNLAVDGSVVQVKQGGHYETILGAILRYRFENGTKITGFSQDAFVGFGLYARLRDAVIPTVMVNWRGFQLGVSYDVTVSALRRAYGGGSLEFSLSYTNMHHALFKTKRRR